MVMEINNNFSKYEKLKSNKDIELLFSKGKSINASPIKAVYYKKETVSGTLINAGVSVPKKYIKLAVKRNLIKRRIKEAYRLNNKKLKSILNITDSEINLMFIYTSKQILPYKEIEDKIKVILKRLIELSEVVGK
jgi:ribonuclease P protein component